MGKKKDKKESAVAEGVKKPVKAEDVKPGRKGAKKDDEQPEEAYRAAAVVFFTRDAEGKPDQVLVAVEERQVAAKFIGLDQKGKVNHKMVVFPQGRKERKDKNDSVETAKREYIEETLDFGGLSKYLDVADFEDKDEESAKDAPPRPNLPELWTGSNNMAVYFAAASMAVLFCEVPKESAKVTTTFANFSPPSEPADEGPDKKKRRKDPLAKPSPSYRVGKTGHLEPEWIDVSHLRAVSESAERAPFLVLRGRECRFFPTNASLLRMPEVRTWLGLPPGRGQAPSEAVDEEAAEEEG